MGPWTPAPAGAGESHAVINAAIPTPIAIDARCLIRNDMVYPLKIEPLDVRELRHDNIHKEMYVY